MRPKVYMFRDTKLTGIGKLKNIHQGRKVALCCSGTTFENYEDSNVPGDFLRVAVNEAIRKLSDVADYWVLSDIPIVLEYAHFVKPQTTVLAMHESSTKINRFCKTAKAIYTVDSMPKPGKYDNPYEFYSRGTVMIGAIEMLRFMGVREFFVFGLDCFALRDKYYYDGRRPVPLSEKRINQATRIKRDLPPEVRIFLTPRLSNMVKKLDEVAASKLWQDTEVFCVASPYSQQKAIPKMSLDEFLAYTKPADPTSQCLVEEREHDQEDKQEQVDVVLEEKRSKRKKKDSRKVLKSEGSEEEGESDSILQSEGINYKDGSRIP